MKDEQKGPYGFANGTSLALGASSFEVVTYMRVETTVFAVSRGKCAPLYRRLVRPVLAFSGLLILAACSADPQINQVRSDWIISNPKLQNDPRKLAIDMGTCQVTAKSSQGTQADSFSDPRYGAVNALADALGRDSINEASVKARQSARFELCMQSRGWTH